MPVNSYEDVIKLIKKAKDDNDMFILADSEETVAAIYEIIDACREDGHDFKYWHAVVDCAPAGKINERISMHVMAAPHDCKAIFAKNLLKLADIATPQSLLEKRTPIITFANDHAKLYAMFSSLATGRSSMIDVDLN